MKYSLLTWEKTRDFELETNVCHKLSSLETDGTMVFGVYSVCQGWASVKGKRKKEL